MKTEDIRQYEIDALFQQLLDDKQLPVCEECKHYLKNPEKCDVCEVKQTLM